MANTAADEMLGRAVRAIQALRADEAERLAGEVLRSRPGDAVALKVLGHALLMQGQPVPAIVHLQDAARRGDDPATELLVAKALCAAGRGEDALDQLRRTVGRRPPFPMAFVELGDQLGDLGRFDEAAEVLESGLELAPDAVVLRLGLGYLDLKRNDRAGARAAVRAGAGGSAERHDVLVALARVMALDGEYAAAADLYRRALELRPDDALTRINLGTLSAGNGRPGSRRSGPARGHARAVLAS